MIGGANGVAGSSKVDASFDLTGTGRFDLKVQRESSRTMDANGEEQKIDTTQHSKGKV